jgi:hypothetical protein
LLEKYHRPSGVLELCIYDRVSAALSPIKGKIGTMRSMIVAPLAGRCTLGRLVQMDEK